MTSLTPFFAYLRSALSESEGIDSSTRLTLFMVAAMVCLVIFTWLGLSVYVTFATVGSPTPVLGLLPFPWVTSAALGGLLGIVAGAKQWQYPKEPENAVPAAPEPSAMPPPPPEPTGLPTP